MTSDGFADRAFVGIPGIEAFAVPELRHGVRVVISRERPPAPSARIAEEWDRLVRQNPALFNGPILSVLSIEIGPERVEIGCRRDQFQRLCVQPTVPTGARLLAVTGILAARDEEGREHVLLGRRSPKTRVFGGMWEVGPSGGVDPPPLSTEEIDERLLLGRLMEEIAEEAGPELGERVRGAPAQVVALTRDHLAFSDDLCIKFAMGGLSTAMRNDEAAGNWEYTRTRWVAKDQIAAFDRDHASEIIPASRALFRVLGWVLD